ncbi:hypothetical protein G6F57_019386 [Rhizopus arrhizus]|nr:hypothetical protein G6F57_019386 [Rhizopus arrhizus]
MRPPRAGGGAPRGAARPTWAALITQPERHCGHGQQDGKAEPKCHKARPGGRRVGVAGDFLQVAVFCREQCFGQPDFAQSFANRIGCARGGREFSLPVLRRQRRRGRTAHLPRGPRVIDDLPVAALAAQPAHDANTQHQHRRRNQHQAHRQYGRDAPRLQDIHHRSRQMDFAMRYSQ